MKNPTFIVVLSSQCDEGLLRLFSEALSTFASGEKFFEATDVQFGPFFVCAEYLPPSSKKRRKIWLRPEHVLTIACGSYDEIGKIGFK
jgi:hypothetical protein